MADDATAGLGNEVAGLLRAHRSIRRYTGERLDEATVHELVRVAQQAATDATGQMYSFIWVRDDARRERLAELAADQDQVRDAGAFFAVCLDVHRLARLLEHRGETFGMGPLVSLLFGITDAALAAQNLVVAAEARGLGICYIGALQNHALEVAEHLELPRGVLPLWGLCIGVPVDDAPREPKPRLPTELVLHVDRYEQPSDEQLDEAYAVMAQATRSGDWVHAVRKYFAEGGHMEAREGTFRRLLERQGLGP